MSEHSENDVDLDPVFTGMTKPSIVMGVPMEFFGINFGAIPSKH